MRLLVFFDLPIETAAQRKRYARFRKGLIKDGYLMLQKSVYSKLAINDAAANAALDRLRREHPSEGLIQVLKVTEKQYATMECIVGNEYEHTAVDTTEELLVI